MPHFSNGKEGILRTTYWGTPTHPAFCWLFQSLFILQSHASPSSDCWLTGGKEVRNGLLSPTASESLHGNWTRGCGLPATVSVQEQAGNGDDVSERIPRIPANVSSAVVSIANRRILLLCGSGCSLYGISTGPSRTLPANQSYFFR